MSGWQPDPVLWGSILASALVYLRWARRTPVWPLRRTLAWLLGLAIVVAALLSPLGAAAGRTFTAHTVAHLLVVVVAPPFLLAGAPVALALHASSRLRPGLQALLRRRWVHLLGHPLTGWTAFTVVVAGSHVPALYDAALDSAPLHALQHVAYLGAGLLFWAPVLAVRPMPRRLSPATRLLVLMAAMPPMIFTSIAVEQASRPWYRTYTAIERRPGAALADQQWGGRLMWWIGVTPVGLVGVGLFMAALGAEERRQQRLDEYMVAQEGRAEPPATNGGGPLGLQNPAES